MWVIFQIYSDPSSSMNKSTISLQKTNSCLLENNTKVLGNDQADINNQMRRKNIKRRTLGPIWKDSVLQWLSCRHWERDSVFWCIKRLQETKLSPVVVFVCDSSVPWNSWTHVIPSLNEKRFRIWKKKTEMLNRFTIWWKCLHSYSCLPAAVVPKSEC